MFDKYKYHQKVLVYLNDRRNRYLAQLEANKTSKIQIYGTEPFSFEPKYISKELNISLKKSKEILIYLTDLEFIERDNHNYMYHANHQTINYIDSGFLKNERTTYIKEFFLKNIKDIIIITVGAITIYTFFAKQNSHDKLIEQKLIIMQSQVEYIQSELTKIEANQKLILSDSIN